MTKVRTKLVPYTTPWFDHHGYQDGVKGLAMAFPQNLDYLNAYKRGMKDKPMEF